MSSDKVSSQSGYVMSPEQSNTLIRNYFTRMNHSGSLSTDRRLRSTRIKYKTAMTCKISIVVLAALLAVYFLHSLVTDVERTGRSEEPQQAETSTP